MDIILQKDLEVLLVKRRNEPFKGYLALPGGFVNEREKIRGHKKETSEELSLEILPGLITLSLFYVGNYG